MSHSTKGWLIVLAWAVLITAYSTFFITRNLVYRDGVPGTTITIDLEPAEPAK